MSPRIRRYRGLLALAVIAIVAAVSVGLYGWSVLKDRRNTITVTAQFDNTAGLYETNRVAVLGMQVGSVTKVTPKTGYVEVEFTVDSDVQIPADAQAVTLQTSILSDRSIELTPPYRGGPTMQDGATIGLTRTRTPVEFTRTLNMIDRLSKSLAGDGKGNGPLRTLMDSAAGMASGNGERIKSALDELSKALRLSADGGAQTREQFTTVVTNLSALFDAAATNDTTLRQFGTTLRQLTDVLAAEDIGKGTTGKQLNTVMTQLGEILENNRDAIKGLAASGNSALDTVIAHQRDLTEILDVGPLALDNLYNVVDRDNGAIRVHLLTDKVLLENQGIKEMCNLMHLRQLGCSTGTLQDFGPDFGVSYILDGLAAMGQR